MNYTLYLQDGGKADQFTEEQVQVIKAMQPYGEAFKLSPGGAIEMAANELHFDIQSPADVSDFLAGLLSYADLVGDGSLKNDIQKFVNGDGLKLILEAPVFRKCGGKVRAKIKKACGGKRLEKGAKVPEVKKGRCPCMYKKVGGRIIEVDCNGIPVAKNGAILFARPGDLLPPAQASLAVKNYMTVKPISSAMSLSDQWFGDLGRAFVRKMDNWLQQLQLRNPDFWGAPAPAKKGTAPSLPAVGSPEWQAQQRKNQEAYYQTPEGLAAIAKADDNVAKRLAEQAAAAEAARKVLEEAALTAAAKARHAFGAGKQGTFGGLTYDQALARQREMQAAKTQGFNVDLGRWGADGKWGSQSRGEWERYQQWKVAQSAQPQMSAGEKFVSEGYASGRPWQDAELQNMDADQAIHLKTPDYNRWMSLNFNQTKAKPYIAPASPVLNPNAVRKDYPTGIAPYTGVNPIVAARKDGGKMSYADYLK